MDCGPLNLICFNSAADVLFKERLDFGEVALWEQE